MASETKACQSNCIYVDATVTLNYSLQRVEGFAYSQLDYVAGLNWHPTVRGDLFRTDDPENVLATAYSVGNGSLVYARVFLDTTNFVSGKTYCTGSTHSVIHRTTGQNVYRGSLQACKTITPTATPTPTPTSTATATPTLIVTPTPTPPTVRLTEVGFTGDRKIRQFRVSGQPYIDEPDGTVSTWRRNNNPKFPVAYLKGTNPTLFAKMTISPVLTSPLSAQVRIRRGSEVVTTPAINVTLTKNEIRVNNIGIPFSKPERAAYVKKGEYKFTWEISFNNGSSWDSLLSGDDKSEHDIHWLHSNPMDEDNFEPFEDHRGVRYKGLFDEALKWSTGRVEGTEIDVKKIIRKINKAMAEKIFYVPNRNPIADNPLVILTGTNNTEAVCQDNALILQGLLKSIGFSDAQIKYHWGGNPSNGQRHYYCPNGGCSPPTSREPVGNRLTLQAKRDRIGCDGGPECVPRYPQFTYHATVEYGNESYDPSYGIVEANVEFLLALEVIPGQTPRCVRGSAATALRVTRNQLGNSSLGANVNPNVTCFVNPDTSYSSAKLFRFDHFGGTNIAVVRTSNGKWIVQDEEGNETETPPLIFNPNTDALAPADYDGDGITDPAVWYADGNVFFRSSLNYYKMDGYNWHPKNAADKAVPGDYDGDKKSDVASRRASDGKWFVRRSSDETEIIVQWGLGSLGDIPVPGDYDGDGKTDFAVWRASTGDWLILKSSDLSVTSLQWGTNGDIPVQGDYDGDGTTDYAVMRPTIGMWYLLESENNYQYRSYQGTTLATNDIPVPADYNGDSKTDIAVWRKSTGMWQIVDSQTGELREQELGDLTLEDIPVISASVFKN